LASELKVAIEAVHAAGEVLREGFGRHQSIRYKGEVDLVTEVDERAEQAIKELVRGRSPRYGVLAEESGQFSGEENVRWIVDPLDGTTNYVHGLPIFSVSVALEKAGEIVLGVVYDPLRDETFVAERGRGASLNGRGLRVSETGDLDRALLVTGFPYDRGAIAATLELFGRFVAVSQSIRCLGSAALDLCYVAAGRLDGYYERGVYEWDIAAGALMVEEAGGTVTDYTGYQLGADTREIVASNGLLHSALVRFTTAAHS
jgi:myo-inositol-1(or 4)-monophosphatase